MLACRFISDSAVISALTEDNRLPAKIKKGLAEKLGLPEDTLLIHINRALTKGVGATQCRPYILTFNNDHKIFLKLSPIRKNAMKEQANADRIIQATLGSENTHPFICMKANSGFIASEKNTSNELLFFPFVPGDNLFITLTHRNTAPEQAIKQFAAIGKALAKMHIDCMQKGNVWDKFVEQDCLLRQILVHDDWQATNLMITPIVTSNDEIEYEAIIIDTEGTACISARPYKNIAESWELSGNKIELLNALLDAYVNEFTENLQEKVRKQVIDALKNDHRIDFEQLTNGLCYKPQNFV